MTWPCSGLLPRSIIVDNEPLKQSGADVVLSCIGMDGDMTLCHLVSRDRVELIANLDVYIEEADVCFIPHCLHATQDGVKRIIILSNETDVHVTFHSQGLQELWIKGGGGW